MKVILVLLILDLCATGGVIIYLSGNHVSEESVTTFSAEEQVSRVTLYIGTNDKDTYTQLISLDDAKETVNNICAKYVEGYTVMQANGGWVDETGMLTEEETLVYSFTDVEEDALVSIMDEVLHELNQNSILVETSDTQSFYYSGESRF